MRQIPLSKGANAIVDDEDYERLNQWKWHLGFGYAVRWETGKSHASRKLISMHRFIMDTPQGMVVDHINGNKIDNRRENLRNCFQTNNRMNQRLKSVHKTSIFKGVSWHKKNKSWRTLVTVNGKQIEIGSFKNEVHAAVAYDLWAKDIYKQYASLNFKGAI